MPGATTVITSKKWLKQVNCGHRNKINAHMKQMALLNQKILFPQHKPHPQPWPATL